jgi:hypothetical protein
MCEIIVLINFDNEEDLWQKPDLENEDIILLTNQ